MTAIDVAVGVLAALFAHDAIRGAITNVARRLDWRWSVNRFPGHADRDWRVRIVRTLYGRTR